MLSLDSVTGQTQGEDALCFKALCCAWGERMSLWEVEVHSVVSVGGLGVALPSILCGDGGRGSCVWRWGAFVHLSGTSACLWLQHESTFGVLPCVGWVETAWRLCGFLVQNGAGNGA